MLIQITNTCRMGCPHCMDCALETPQHMADSTFERALEFAYWSGVNVLSISGGEPTEHPKWIEYVMKAADSNLGFVSVALPSNGMWLLDEAKQNAMLMLMSSYRNLSVQVSSFPGLYRMREEILAKADDFKQRLKAEGVKHRFNVETDRKVIDPKMLALGRAAQNDEYSRLAAESVMTTSCFASALVAAQLPFKDAVSKLETMGKFCHPLVDWKGEVKWSESCLCPGFGKVTDDFSQLAIKASEWRPCGKCADYKKLLAKSDMKYAVAKAIMGIR